MRSEPERDRWGVGDGQLAGLVRDGPRPAAPLPDSHHQGRMTSTSTPASRAFARFIDEAWATVDHHQTPGTCRACSDYDRDPVNNYSCSRAAILVMATFLALHWQVRGDLDFRSDYSVLADLALHYVDLANNARRSDFRDDWLIMADLAAVLAEDYRPAASPGPSEPPT